VASTIRRRVSSTAEDRRVIEYDRGLIWLTDACRSITGKDLEEGSALLAEETEDP